MIDEIDLERVRILSLNRPPSNVLNLELLEGLAESVAKAAADPRVRCLILTSRLPKYFSSGLDLQEMMSLPADRQSRFFAKLLEAYRRLLSCPKPVVAALNGSALLGGWILALGCDFRIMAAGGRISLSEIRFGLSPTSLLIRRMKDLAANALVVKEMVLRGKNLKAEEAAAAGLVDRVVGEEELPEEAMREAKSLAKLSPPAYASVKRSLALDALEFEILWKKSQEEFWELFSNPLTQDGVKAFAEKRRPKWED